MTDDNLSKMTNRALLLLLLTGIFLNAPQVAKPALAAARKGTGLALPRFVSLRAGEVNMRAGPGVQYPVEWVYRRRYLPVEIIAEYDTWRKVRDWQGSQGWIHQSMLGGKRTVIVTGKVRNLRKKDDADSPPAARMEVGVIANLLACPATSGWCSVEINGINGWLRRVDFWGIRRDEVIE